LESRYLQLLEGSGSGEPKRIRYKAMKYVLIGDNMFYRIRYKAMKYVLIRSSPYYAQVNGLAEASNQSLIKLIKRKIDEHPRRWHEVLSEALWAYRISCHGATKTSPYHLVYGQEAVLPWVIMAGSRRKEFQNDLIAEEYVALTLVT
jgi:hypothetical protein